MKRESQIQNEIRLALAKIQGLTMWRNNTGRAWTGNKIERRGSIVIIYDARPINFGLFPGSSDLIGLQSITITPDMVGQKIARFAAVEVKNQKGKLSEKQINFNDFVNNAGGVAIVARSEDDLAVLL